MTPHYLQLILYKARADLKVEAARGYMGMLWWVLEPVLYMGAFYIIFAVALQRGGENFVPWLLTGLVVWKWFDTTVRMSLNVIVAGKGLMSQVYLPKVFFPAVVILKNSVKFLVTLLLLLLFLLLYGVSPGWPWLMLPLLLLLQGLLICGVSFTVSALTPLYPDLKLLMNNVLMLMFFLSGVFFDTSNLHGWLGVLLDLNPMVHIIHAWRDVLLFGRWPDMSVLGLVALLSLALCALGLFLLHRFDRLYPRLA
ncbi:MAG TPA: ABC transporter permease [Chromatiaceae bacterium]|nr:ABC transporter permease [Chromatiaceae bacterium]